MIISLSFIRHSGESRNPSQRQKDSGLRRSDDQIGLDSGELPLFLLDIVVRQGTAVIGLGFGFAGGLIRLE